MSDVEPPPELTPTELAERQERIVEALLDVVDVVTEMGEHAGFSPAKRLRARILSILDGKPAEASATPSIETATEDDES